MPDTNGWGEYQRLVLKKLEEHDVLLREMHGELTKIHVQIGMLQVKSGVWGLLGGLIPAIGVIFLAIAKGLL